MNNKVFPFKPIGDIIIVDKTIVKSRIQKKADKSNILMADGKAPTNILDMERKAMEEASNYADLRGKFEFMWDQHPNQGYVVAVGPGKDSPEGLYPMSVKAGDKIYFRGSTGDPIIINKRMYIVIREYDIYGVDPKY